LYANAARVIPIARDRSGLHACERSYRLATYRLLEIALGYVVIGKLRSVDDYEVLLTVGLVMGGHAAVA
jgi:hypothetical protein